jgi:hypothetical protein
MKNLNVNLDFLLDIWADLKAKRLAPVAVGLVVSLVAMPALLMKGEGGAADGPIPVAPVADDGAQVVVAGELAERDSKLDSYTPRDPFKGRVRPRKAGAGGGSAAVPGAVAKGGGVTSGSTGGVPSGSGGGLPLGGGGTGGASPAPAPEPPIVIRKPSARYTYQLDLRFGRPGRETRYRRLPRLTFLPSERVPAVLFMGVPADEKSALFFLQPGLSHQGEGDCVPSRKHCNFLNLGIGREHYLAAGDYEFRIKLLDIKRVKLSEEKRRREAARTASRGRRSSRTAGKTGAAAGAGAELELPLLADGVG